MPNLRFLPLSLAAGLALLSFACEQKPTVNSPAAANPPATPASPSSPLAVTVSIPPQADIIRRIGGNLIDVNVFVPAGQDPHHFSATPKQVNALAESRALFTIGMPFESSLVPKVRDTLPHLRIVNIAEAIALLEEEDDEHDHDHHENDSEGKDHDNDSAHAEHHEDEHPDHNDHENEDEHAHHHDHDHSSDPHVWLSPPHLKILAHETHDTLAFLDPANASVYSANLDAFLQELDSLHAELTRLLAPLRDQAFYVYHPAFGHFANTYGLQQEAIEAGGKSPSPKQLMRLIEQAKANRAKVIFVQPQFDPSSAKTVAKAIGGRVAPIDPLAENVTENLRSIAGTIHDALATQ